MTYIIFKYLITAALIVLISELAKFSDKIGAFTSALPLVTITGILAILICFCCFDT